eukprot:6211941-Pleurochrysis_carterae.AAC.5
MRLCPCVCECERESARTRACVRKRRRVETLRDFSARARRRSPSTTEISFDSRLTIPNWSLRPSRRLSCSCGPRSDAENTTHARAAAQRRLAPGGGTRCMLGIRTLSLALGARNEPLEQFSVRLVKLARARNIDTEAYAK